MKSSSLLSHMPRTGPGAGNKAQTKMQFLKDILAVQWLRHTRANEQKQEHWNQDKTFSCKVPPASSTGKS